MTRPSQPNKRTIKFKPGQRLVVFGGETLQAMTNNEILAAAHEVRIPDEAGVGHFGVSWDQTMTRVNKERFPGLSLCSEQPTQNWSGQGESDCLIKTKHCDGLKRC